MKVNTVKNDPFLRPSELTRLTARMRWAAWRLPVALIMLSIIPLIFGALRLNELATGGPVIPANARFFAAPMPVVLHIAAAGLYALLGAFQFVSRLWQRGHSWHRIAGRILVPCGLVVAVSGLWMTLFYPRPAEASDLLYVFRLIFSSGMVLSLCLGFVAIRRRQIGQHRAWMIRAYAIGLGAGTQVFTGMVGELLLGPPNVHENALLLGSAWFINLAVAEWIIRRRSVRQIRTVSIER